MNERKITYKFSAPGHTVLIVDEELPKGIWIGDKVKADNLVFTITGIPISDRNTFMVDETDKIDVNQIVESFTIKIVGAFFIHEFRRYGLCLSLYIGVELITTKENSLLK